MKSVLWLSSFNENTKSGYCSNKFASYYNSYKDSFDSTYYFINLFSNQHTAHLSYAHFFDLLDSLKEKVIVYNIENSRISRALLFLLKCYPGVVIAYDNTFFNLALSQYEHGTTGVEINSYFNKHYGLSAIRVGDQFALEKSLDIYSDIYTCEFECRNYATALYYFCPWTEEPEFSFPDHNVHKRIISSSLKDRYHFLLVNNKEHGSLFDSIYNHTGMKKCILFIVYEKIETNWRVSFTPLRDDVAVVCNLLDVYDVDAIIENYSSIYSGASIWFYKAQDRNIAYFCSETTDSLKRSKSKHNVIENSITLETLLSTLLFTDSFECKIDWDQKCNIIKSFITAQFNHSATILSSRCRAIDEAQMLAKKRICKNFFDDPILSDELCCRFYVDALS